MPVSLSLAKQHLEYEDDDRDSLIAQYIGAAAAWVENHTGKVLSQREVVQTFECFGSFVELLKGPLISVTSVAYVDALEAPQSVTGYRVRGNRIYAPIAGWPSIADYSTIAVTYQAGYATTPADLVSAQLLLIGHYFQSREAVNVATSVTELPLAVESLCRPYRALHV